MPTTRPLELTDTELDRLRYFLEQIADRTKDPKEVWRLQHSIASGRAAVAAAATVGVLETRMESVHYYAEKALGVLGVAK